MCLSGLFVIGERRVVVHLQALSVPLATLLLILALPFTAALAAAAAARPAEGHGGRDHAIPRRQRVQREWQEVPGAQRPW